MLARSPCFCHDGASATAEAARQMSNYPKAYTHSQRAKYHVGPLLTDAVEAVSACKLCLNAHVPAITHRGSPEPRTQWIDEGYPQADGEGKE